MVRNALQALDSSAADVTVSLGSAVAQPQLVQQLQQAAGVSAGLEDSNEDTNASLLAQLPLIVERLQAAAKLADLLHQWWQPATQPEKHAKAQLALAQAAATRSCAYLRCANLGGEGGPAAGKGVGSKKCRWVAGQPHMQGGRWFLGCALSIAFEGVHCRTGG